MIVCHENPHNGPWFSFTLFIKFWLFVTKFMCIESHKVEGRCLRSTHPTQPYCPLACLFSRNYVSPPYNGKKYNQSPWLWGQYLGSFWVKLIIPTHPCSHHKSTQKFKISQPHTKGLLKREKAFYGGNSEWVLGVLKGENLSPKGQRS